MGSCRRSRLPCFITPPLAETKSDVGARLTIVVAESRLPHPSSVRTWVGIFVTTYMLPASVSWWNGDNHLPPFFCQIDVAKTFDPCFLPSQVASCVAAYVMTTVSLSSHI